MPEREIVEEALCFLARVPPERSFTTKELCEATGLPPGPTQLLLMDLFLLDAVERQPESGEATQAPRYRWRTTDQLREIVVRAGPSGVDLYRKSLDLYRRTRDKRVGREQHNAVDFRLQYPQPPEIAETGASVQVLHNILGGAQLRVAIVLDDDTRLSHIQKAWPFIENWRDQLLEFQGPTWDDWTLLWEQLCSRKEAGETYRQLAERVNVLIANLVKEHAELLQDYPFLLKKAEAIRHFTGWEGLLQWMHMKEERYGPLPLPGFYKATMDVRREQALEIMQKMGVPEAEREFRQAVERIEKDEPPFEQGHPVSWRMLRERIRRWRDGPKHKALLEMEARYKSRGK